MIKKLLEVKSNKSIADQIYEMKLAGKYNLDDFKPGKFLHIKCSDTIEPLLRRPMSICDINDSGTELTMLYRKEGKGTRLLAEKEAGDVLDVLAPLGEAFALDAVEAGQTVMLVGGGIGVPPLYYLGRKLKQKGVKIRSILGFASAKDVFYENEFAELGQVQITTIDGSHATQGMVTDVLDESWDVFYSCGPNAMLKALQGKVAETKKAYMSLEERMGCGLGACLACVCRPKGDYRSDTGYLRACSEGPVFPLHAIEL